MTYTELDHRVTIESLKQDYAELVALAWNLLFALEREAQEFDLDNYGEDTIQAMDEAKSKLGINQGE